MVHRKRCRALLGLAVVFTVSSGAIAIPMQIPLVETDFAAMGVVAPASALIVSPWDYNSVFTGDVLSQAFELASGDYLYLYQAENHGPSVLEIMAISPFTDLVGSGYLLAGSEPAGFLAGGLLPIGATYDAGVPSPVISYNYPSWMGAYIPAGAHGRTMYLVSPNAPTMGEAYIIDSGTAVTDVVVPLPEPATMGLLALGGALLMVRRRHRA